MSTYLDYYRGEAVLKAGVSAHEMIEGMQKYFCTTVELDALKTDANGRDHVYFCADDRDVGAYWSDNLLAMLRTYCDSWTVNAKEQNCYWVSFTKTDGTEHEARGHELVYFDGFEDEFIDDLPQQIIDKIRTAK